MRGGSSIKFVVFALTPLVLLLVAAETTVRFKYFFAHNYDWHYLTAPFPLREPSESEGARRLIPTQVREALQMAAAPRAPASPDTPAGSSPATPSGRPGSTVAPATPAAQARPAASAPVAGPPSPVAPAPSVSLQAALSPAATYRDQMIFLWPRPCESGSVYSTEQQTVLPRTWDQYCFRGDRVTPDKGAREFRVVFLGGSTVQGFQSDEEMMPAQFKRAFLGTPPTKTLTVINAGRSGFDSRQILQDYRARVSRFSADLAVYYEAWNEQPNDMKPSVQADRLIGAFGVTNQLHRTLYQRSWLYTYLVEKYAFMSTTRARFWKIDVRVLRNNFHDLSREVGRHGTRFVFVTQVLRFPRTWKGIDTFDYQAVNALLDRLKADRSYAYDVTEISALNQRLAVSYTLNVCRELGVPVVNIMAPIEALGDAGRAELFMDLGHLTVKGDRVVGRLIAAGLDTSH